MGSTPNQFRLAAIAPILAAAHFASAQALNIDLGGSISPKPSETYGAAANQPGYWNDDQFNTPLTDITGTITTVRAGWSDATRSGAVFGDGGDEARFMSSFFAMGTESGFNFYAVGGLKPGQYDFYLYGWSGAATGAGATGFRVSNGVDVSTKVINFGSRWPGRQIENETFAKIRMSVAPDTFSIRIHVDGDTANFGIFNGLQIVPVPAPGAALPLLGVTAWAARRRHGRACPAPISNSREV